MTSISRIYPVNTHLKQGLVSHPTTDITVERYIGTETFTTTALAVGGNSVVTDSNENRTTNSTTPVGFRQGFAAGTVLWIVLTHLGGTADTKGEIQLVFEERFDD